MDSLTMTKLRNLKSLLDDGIITTAEYAIQKQNFLDLTPPAPLHAKPEPAAAPPAKKPKHSGACFDEHGKAKVCVHFGDGKQIHLTVLKTTALYKIIKAVATSLKVATPEYVTRQYRVLFDGMRVLPHKLVSEETIFEFLTRYDYDFDDEQIRFDFQIEQHGGAVQGELVVSVGSTNPVNVNAPEKPLRENEP
ncbi:hypothetical protein M885DRAFT_560037 [Pelagophyceae sp. CCMP2097]|nr:hypothetical protein M885DRAFT_560037 [Pelagophyceae sp. CCMP2097]